MLILLKRRSLSFSQYDLDLSSLAYGEKEVKASDFLRRRRGGRILKR